MPEIETVGTVTDEDLRRAAMAAANRHIHRARALGPGEFTIGDWQAHVKATEGVGLSDATAKRELEVLVKDAVLGRTTQDDKRYDPRSQRLVVAYWYLDGDGEGPGGPAGRDPP